MHALMIMMMHDSWVTYLVVVVTPVHDYPGKRTEILDIHTGKRHADTFTVIT